jgi:hypothetical protein
MADFARDWLGAPLLAAVVAALVQVSCTETTEAAKTQEPEPSDSSPDLYAVYKLGLDDPRFDWDEDRRFAPFRAHPVFEQTRLYETSRGALPKALQSMPGTRDATVDAFLTANLTTSRLRRGFAAKRPVELLSPYRRPGQTEPPSQRSIDLMKANAPFGMDLITLSEIGYDPRSRQALFCRQTDRSGFLVLAFHNGDAWILQDFAPLYGTLAPP